MNNIFFISLIVFYLSHYLILNWKAVHELLIDKKINKIQSFHEKATIRSGGILIFVTCFFFLIFYQNDLKKLNFLIYFLVANFIIGFFADAKFIQSPFKRFFLMFLINSLIIFYFEFYIIKFNFILLDYLNSFLIFKALLVFLALFFIINGSNLIDGFNGLLSIHVSIIILVLFLVCKNNNLEIEFERYLIFLIFLNILFLTLNFPNAKIFLGDSGAYFLGTHVAVISIYLANNFKMISSFFIANILFYLFFEILFSVFRKISQKKNPFFPDDKHLHMLLFKLFKKKTKFANPITSAVINFIFCLTIIPSYIYFDNDYVCKIIFFLQIITYISFYLFLIKSNSHANIRS